ncbi:hypothetical protein [Mycolicibacter minnesotensis]
MAPKTGTLIHLVARDGRQDEVAAILGESLAAVARDRQTSTWYAYRITDTEFGVFDTSSSDQVSAGRDSGTVLSRLTDELLANEPVVQPFAVVAAKV